MAPLSASYPVLTLLLSVFSGERLTLLRFCGVGVVLLGVIGKYGVTVKYAHSGTPCASFTLVVSEQGQDGKEHQTYVECECWGKKAYVAGGCEAGQLVLFEGKLRKRQKGEQWELCVSGFELTPIVAPVAASHN